MIDLHTHTLFSDGVLLPAELIRRCEAKGFRGLVITDHVDYSNIDMVIPNVLKACREISAVSRIKVFGGVELTHLRPEHIKSMVKRAKELGAYLVLVHGETITEPVLPGTNRAAIEAGADILVHPGIITEDDTKLAAKNGVRLEISGRKGHAYANGHVAKVAKKIGAKLVFGSDSHTPDDLLDRSRAEFIARGAGLEEDDIQEMFKEAELLIGL
ncbi:PHP domain-containing protein [Candidatus Brocadia sapporoensis]|uniref:PHP domain-containing protein n=1 Tax=Candidatus Brocadia sapporoensis TaxID=392547 RepID=A0A1V6LYS6_9BACT|nr:histidinol phosphate phosphatase domain-containing protein [Candidatus Brocadia sapporoensis]MDG6004767.1 histidinol phosphate phosphatase domain-containing protein [Candidatus Brocadia sp.]OQD45246.1 PHP domain-containing protein [Candidatus Brocadia sapporoensis]GJQ22888.1 MAG: PHP domain-containing protein [Candidatus Brocadia sapporoensis]